MLPIFLENDVGSNLVKHYLPIPYGLILQRQSSLFF